MKESPGRSQEGFVKANWNAQKSTLLMFQFQIVF